MNNIDDFYGIDLVRKVIVDKDDIKIQYLTHHCVNDILEPTILTKQYTTNKQISEFDNDILKIIKSGCKLLSEHNNEKGIIVDKYDFNNISDNFILLLIEKIESVYDNMKNSNKTPTHIFTNNNISNIIKKYCNTSHIINKLIIFEDHKDVNNTIYIYNKPDKSCTQSGYYMYYNNISNLYTVIDLGFYPERSCYSFDINFK